MPSQEESIAELGKHITHVLLSDQDFLRVVNAVTMIDLGRPALDSGDDGDDPLFAAVEAQVIIKALLHAASQMRFFPDA